jgi:hypothetical protein
LHLHTSSETPIDLQLHTTYSDGRWAAEHHFDYLAQEGFGLVAVTDHDRVDTVESIQHLGVQKQVPVLAAVDPILTPTKNISSNDGMRGAGMLSSCIVRSKRKDIPGPTRRLVASLLPGGHSKGRRAVSSRSSLPLKL